MVMRNSDELFPPLLETWLQTSVYEENIKCEKHEKYKSVYCYVCRKEPVCQKCWEATPDEHEDHKSSHLTVKTCSRKTSVRKEDISRLWDVSEIQLNKANYDQVVYLIPPHNVTKATNEEDGCKICNTRLIDPRNFKYCSITCKKIKIERTQEEPVVKKQKGYCEPVSSPPIKKQKQYCEPGSFRTVERRRKGNPIRSPLS